MRKRIHRYIWQHHADDGPVPGSAWRHFLQLIAMIGRDLMGGMITLHAMSLVYTTMLSIVPLLAVSISALKGFGVHDQLEPTLVRLLQPIGEQNVEISARIVGFVENMKLGVLGSVGLLLLLYTAVSLIRKIEFAFNHSWRLQNNRRPMQRFGNYLSVIVVGPVLVFAAVGITALLGNSHVVDFLNGLPYMNNLLRVSGKLLPFVLVIAAFTFVYMLVPNTRVQFRSAFYGAVVAGVLWQALGIVFTSFVGGSSSYTAIYSGLAILLVFMIWLYLSWIILLIGSGISFYHQHPEYLKWEKLDLHLSTRMRDQLALQAMVNIARAHDDRQFAGGSSLGNLAAYQRVPVDVLQRILNALQADGLIRRSADDPPQYLPGASLRKIYLFDILRCARQAKDPDRSAGLRVDPPVSAMLGELERNLETYLGEKTLADLLLNFEDETTHEDSLV